MTTHDWEALLDGATPGPWRWHWSLGGDSIQGPDGTAIATSLCAGESDLLAAAPDAVAEVIRLRRDIEAMRDDWEHAAERTAAMVALWPHGHRAARTIKTRQQVSRRLTRILEGSSGK